MSPWEIEAFAPVLTIVGLAAIAGWVFTTWLRIKHGYPLEDSWGRPVSRQGIADGDKRLAALAEENRHLRTELGELKNRIAVLERIATDPAARVDREIAALRGEMN